MKKMRRLIPAVAMLMVAAVMLSTASFAWFTMNDVVTASGMQVQAKAAGNLLISKSLLSATDKAISVDFSDVAKKNLKPITYVPAVLEDNGSVKTPAKWQAVGTSTDVDPLYGTFTGTLDDVTNLSMAAAGDYFYEQVVYLATAGTAYTAPVEMDIEAIAGADEDIAPAYTVAIIVGDTIDWTQPDLVYNLQTKKAGGTFIQTTESYTIPSTYGTTSTSAVGLKVTIRIYVDGDLDGEPVTVQKKTLKDMDFSSSKTYNPTTMANWTFFSANDESAVVDKTGFDENTNLEELKITHYWVAGEYTSETHATKYVNNENVPVSGTVFSVSFKAVDPNAND